MLWVANSTSACCDSMSIPSAKNFAWRNTVHIKSPAPDLLLLFAARISFPSSFNLWPVIALDYFTYCEVPLAKCTL